MDPQDEIARLQERLATLEARVGRDRGRARRTLGLVILGVGLAWTVSAFSQAALTVFQGGTPALASAINANFSLVKSWIDGNTSAINSNDGELAGIAAKIGASSDVRISTNTIRIPNNVGTLSIQDDDGENIMQITEVGGGALVALSDPGGTNLTATGYIRGACPPGTSRIGGWCMTTARQTTANYTDAMTGCHNQGMSVCPIGAYMACDSLEPSGNACTTDTDANVWLWTSEAYGNDVGAYGAIQLYNGMGNDATNELDLAPDSNTYAYYCCAWGYFN